MIKTKKQMFLVIGAFALILLLGTASYAFFNYTRTGGTNRVGIGRIYFNTDQGNDTLTLTNIFPMTSSQANTANLDSVAVHIQGDTTYNDGEEFEITLVNVTNTVNGKTIPINYTATYTATTNKGIGTESSSYSDYFTDRGSSSSKYTLEETGEVSEGKQVLVGFIPKNGEVDGTLTIKAYIDSSKVVISDTLENGAIEVTGYNNGYPQPAGAVVLTTEEWNSLQGAGTIKFSVRGIANEGTWVTSPAPATPPTCPGPQCVYTKSENNIGQAISGTLGTDYKTSYADYGNYFLGHILNNGVIAESYACGINNGTVFCLRGGVDESSLTDKPIYTDNVGRLNTAFPSCNAGPGAYCSGSVTGIANSGGGVNVHDGSGLCGVNGDGSSGCTE